MPRRDQPDHYSKRARSEGYSARSVYKLQELDRRFSLIQSGGRVLDVGAAPGSWSQYAAKVVGPAGRIVAVDLSEMPDLAGIPNVVAITGDILQPDVVTALADHGPYHLIMSDAAPKTTGNRVVDTSRSAALVEQVISLCDTLLSRDGHLLAKVFQGGEEQQLLAMARERFSTARLVRPKATRSESFETYLVGLSRSR